MNTSNANTDVALMLEVTGGDEFAFAELYRRYDRKLQNFFYGMSRNPQLASELRQETFLRIWKLRDRYVAGNSFASYLFAVARNVWLENIRQFKRLARLGARQDLECCPELACDSLSNPDAMAWRSEIHDRILEALGALPEEQRMVFVMRVVDGLSLDEVARAMKCPVNTVRSRKLLAMKKLKKALKELQPC